MARVKTLEQQDIQTLLRIRNQFKEARQKNANQLRGLLSEYGIVLLTGMNQLSKEPPNILEDADNELTVMARQAFTTLLQQHRDLSEKKAHMDLQQKHSPRDTLLPSN